MGGMRFKLYHEAVGEYELKHAPKGWDGLRYKLLRDKVYHGISREFSIDLEFVKDGFDFIHSIYEAFGIRGNILIFVYEENPHNLRYELAYQGILALEKWNAVDGDGATGRYGVTNIDFIGFTQRFINSEDVEVNINAGTGIHGQALAPLPAVPITLHSQAINQSYYAQNTVGIEQFVWMVAKGTEREGFILFGFDKVDINDLGVYDYQTGVVTSEEAPEIFTASGAGEHAITIDIKGLLRIEREGALDAVKTDDFDFASFGIYLQKNDEPPIELHRQIDTDVVSDFISYYAITKTFTLALEEGDKVKFYGTFGVSLIDGNLVGNYDFPVSLQLERGSSLKVEATTTSEAYTTKGTLIYEAFAAICSSYTGYTRAFYSDFFGRTDSEPLQYPVDGEGSHLMVVNGFKLRGLDYEAVVLKYEVVNALRKIAGLPPLAVPPNDGKYDIFTSFKDLFTATDAIWCLGAGVEVVNGELMVRVEKRKHFYASDIVLELGRVSKLQKQVAAEDYYNEAEFGYSEWKVESENGLLEFNAKHSYTIPNEKIKSKYTALCPYLASGYRIEKTKRERLVSSQNKDTADDDKNFFICVRRVDGGWESEQGEVYVATTGIAQVDTAYNLRINPVAIRDNHLPVVRHSFYKHPEEAALRFNKGEANYSITLTDMDGKVLEGGKDVLHKDMPPALYIPEVYRFEYELNHHQLRQLRENPYGIIRFRDQYDNILMGHIMEVDATTHDGLSQFTLKRAYDA